MANNILLLGNGEHCKSIIDSLLNLNFYDEIGIVSKEKENINYRNVKCVGEDKDLANLRSCGWNHAFVAVGSTRVTDIRKKLYDNIKSIGFNIPNIIDNSAILSNSITLGEGIFIGKGVIINCDVSIGNNSIINTGSVIEHNCILGVGVHIAPNSTLCGNVNIGNNSHIGAGTTIRQCITIGSNSTIGIGSVVVDDISDNVIAFGNPCKVKK